MEENKAEFSGVPIVVLESVRIRLAQLVHSLTNLSNRVQTAELPAWPGLQQQFNVVLLQLSSLASTLLSFAPALQRCVAYPMPTFPLNTNAWLLTTLLRKKNLPEVDEWIAKGVEAGKDVDHKMDDDFSEWALETANELGTIEVASQMFPPKTEPNGWNIDKVVGFLSGHEVE